MGHLTRPFYKAPFSYTILLLSSGVLILNIGFAGECGIGMSVSRPVLSGTPTMISTTNFRVHYTTSGVDASAQQWADSVAVYVEEVRTTSQVH